MNTAEKRNFGNIVPELVEGLPGRDQADGLRRLARTKPRHARVIAVESEREFGLSVLQRLDVELSNRGEIYRTAGVNDLASYRDYAANLAPGDSPGAKLPRIMLIVDEFQEFFIEDDKLAQESALLLDRSPDA